MARSHAASAELRAVLRVFALFGHPLRVIIFQRLTRAPRCAAELSQGLPVSRTAVVQHLKRLQRARLVYAVRAGRRLRYHADPRGLAVLARWLARHRAR